MAAEVINIFEFHLSSKPSYFLFQLLTRYVNVGGHLNWEDRLLYEELCCVKRTDESRRSEIVDLIVRLIEAGLMPTSVIN